MNSRTVTWIGTPALAVGLLLGAAPAHAGTGIQVDGATVPGGASTTVSVTVEYSCDAAGFVRSATVVAEDQRSGALGSSRFTPVCTGATVRTVVPVASLNGNGYSVGDPVGVHASLVDGEDNEVLGTVSRVTVANG
ncbi:hypothetical protein AB0O91_15570 [Kitasatospora sp. NPDC089797]|uniref:hypothetical protein n=1 Tax=Kitasatospora sp. NPDC089797 TaxID=3155298 RepID=UPI003442BA51